MDRTMLEGMVTKFQEDNIALLKVNTKLLENQTTLRDSIAREVYTFFLEIDESYEQAAVDSYQAADVMMKKR